MVLTLDTDFLLFTGSFTDTLASFAHNKQSCLKSDLLSEECKLVLDSAVGPESNFF